MVRRTATLGLLAAAVLAALASNVPPEESTVLPPVESACAALITRTCGPASECIGQAWCEAAGLLAAQDRDGTRCQDAFVDPDRYPACDPADDEVSPEDLSTWGDACLVLLDRVCGLERAGGRACAAEAACLNAELLDQTTLASEDGGLSAYERKQALCRAALHEQALYPRCSL